MKRLNALNHWEKSLHREFSVEANIGEAYVKPQRGGRSQKLPVLYMGLTR